MSLSTRTCFWFESGALEAAELYVSLLPDSRIDLVRRPGPDAPPIMVDFTLAGTPYCALNGGPHYRLSAAASIVVRCDSQAAADDLWDVLSDGGEEIQCGWLTDRYGLSWQILPGDIDTWLFGPNPAGAKRAFEAMMGMKRLDLAALRAAYESA